MFSNRIRTQEWKDHFGVDLIPVLSFTATMILGYLTSFNFNLGTATALQVAVRIRNNLCKILRLSHNNLINGCYY